MDSSQLFCAFLVSAMIGLFLKSIIYPENPPKNQTNRPSSSSISKSEHSKDKTKEGIIHDVMELRHLSLSVLQNYNVQYGKITDRYWREIFRRQNDSHHPDHINVTNLTTSNIITALDENFPPGPIHECTITGLIPKPFSSRKCEVMRYLRERLSSSPNVELVVEADRVRITSTKS